MTCSVCSGSTTVGLTALAILERLATKRPLVDLAVTSPRERYAKVLQLHASNKQCIVVGEFNN